jgi:hypothetical protein
MIAETLLWPCRSALSQHSFSDHGAGWLAVGDMVHAVDNPARLAAPGKA